jgi:type VI secretion system secreted protein VgrG
MNLSDLQELLRQGQHNRFLQLTFPHKDGPQAELLPQELHAVESMGQDFQFHIECLSSDASLELKELMGKMVTIRLHREDGSQRFFNGYVYAFSLRSADGGMATYQMVLRPWLAFTELRRDNYLFHGKTLRDQTELTFADYDVADWEWRCTDDDPAYTDACQFNESDYNYLHRRWESRGVFYWYEHREDGHTLVLADHSPSQCKPVDGPATMRYQAEAGSLEDDGIRRFVPLRVASASAYAMSSWDFKNPRPMRATTPGITEQGNVPALEIHDWGGAYAFKSPTEGQALTKRRIEALEAQAKRFEADGNERWAQPGRTFSLVHHFEFGALGTPEGDGEFLILQVQHHARANHEQFGSQRGGGGREYQCAFTCLRKKIPWRPLPGHNSSDPRIVGPQTAVVVGPPGEEIYTDKYGRVKVQFHWDRVGTYDHRSSAWIRVSSSWTGKGYGFVGIPRVGQEVVVQFLDGNPDRPLVTGCVYNEENMPPFDLPGGAHKTGLQTRSTPGAGGLCEMVIHDQTGQELINILSQKDMVRTVLNNDATVIQGPQQTIAVTTGTQATTVKKHITLVSETESISHHAHRAFEVKANTEHITLEANTDIVLKVGKSTLHMNADGSILIDGVIVTVRGSGKVDVNP